MDYAVVPLSLGGNGTPSPALTAGSGITLTGTWPNYTISATGGSGFPNSATAGVLGYPGGSSLPPTNLTALPSGVSVDVSLLTQTSSSDTIPSTLIAGTSVAYPAGSTTLTISNNGNVIDNVSASPATITLPTIGSGGVNAGAYQVVPANFGTGLNTVSSSSTINGAGSSAYLPQYGWALSLADNTAGNYVLLEGGGYQFTSTGVPLWSTAIEANGFIPLSVSCGSGGARLAEYSTAGLDLCVSGAAGITIDNNGDASFVAGGYLNFPTSTGTVVIPPGGGLYNNGSAGTVDLGTNGANAIHVDSAQNVYVKNLSTYSLVANSNAGTLASIPYGALNTTLRGQGTTNPPAFSTNTTPNTDTTGDIWYASTTNTMTALPIGSTGAVLTISGGVPAWSSVAAPTVSCISNCPANNATVGFTAGFTNTFTAITGTSLTFVPGEAGVLTTTGTLPTNFATSTTYYVNSTGLSTTGFQLCASPPTLVGGTWTACTSISAGSAGSGTQTFTGTGNYINIGTTATSGFVVMPEGTYAAGTTIGLTWAKTATNGYVCSGTDIASTPALLTQTSVYSTNSCRLLKSTAATALDIFAWQTAGPT